MFCVCVYVCVWCVLVFVWLFFVCVSSSCMIFLVLCFGACTNCSRIRFLSLACRLFLSLNSIGNEPNNRATQLHVRVPLLGVSNLVSPCILFQFREWVGKQNTVCFCCYVACGCSLLTVVFLSCIIECAVSLAVVTVPLVSVNFVLCVRWLFDSAVSVCFVVCCLVVWCFRGLQILATKKNKNKRGNQEFN